ncbi:hypothetical protein BCON_0683g00030 [Botryotinia convoluta]|uniref:Uncharacterized protein n=1 Tax=Botryotinia convoluta TaxID=54673 RepID=A0A4Z1H445_9HELO|nr:hypothetical protein BCON_0683g00030 [Botryotinia convoluta]
MSYEGEQGHNYCTGIEFGPFETLSQIISEVTRRFIINGDKLGRKQVHPLCSIILDVNPSLVKHLNYHWSIVVQWLDVWSYQH